MATVYYFGKVERWSDKQILDVSLPKILKMFKAKLPEIRNKFIVYLA